MRSIEIHNELIRKNLEKHIGFEVKNNGESFMAAFPDTVQALNFCLRVQTGIKTSVIIVFYETNCLFFRST